MKIYFLLIYVTLLCVASLHANEDKAIKDILLKYNYGIIKMGRSGETEFFKSFVKEDVAVKLQVWFESWKFSNLTFLAELNDLRFSPIAYNENNATIRTIENWTFSYVNLATKKIALEPTKIFYKMQYTLQKNDNKWMIVAIKKLKEEKFTKPNTNKPSLKTKKKESKDEMPN